MRINLIRFATVAAMAAGMAFAQGPAKAPPPARGGGYMQGRDQWHQRMVQELNLSDAQKKQSDEIFQKARDTAKPVREEMKQNREALNAAIKANDTARIHTLAAKQGTLMGQMIEIRAVSRAQFRAILTPEQQVKADKMHEQMMQRRQERMGSRTEE